MAQWITTIIAIIGVILTLLKMLQDNAKAAQENVKHQQRIKSQVEHLEGDVMEIKKTLGNGGFSGLKGDISDMRVNCAKEMTALRMQVAAHLSRDNKQ